jgi:hypothetical protein
MNAGCLTTAAHQVNVLGTVAPHTDITHTPHALPAVFQRLALYV